MNKSLLGSHSVSSSHAMYFFMHFSSYIDFIFKSNVLQNHKTFRNTIRVPNSLGTDQALGQSSLQKFSEDDKVAASKERLKT